VSNFEKQPLI